jgi:hypothetical protein
MALRTTLEELVEMVRDEARLSSNNSRGVDHRPHIIRLIKRHYQTLLEEHEWEHLQIKREDAGKTMQAGQRYYDFPVNLDTGRISKVWYKWGNDWRELIYGISPHDYNDQDSDDGERRDPAEKWDFYSAQQFEVWPTPISNSNEVRFEGVRKGEQLLMENSRADLDDNMIALFVAGEVLAENGQKDAAQLKIEAARRIMGQQKRRFSGNSRVRMGLGCGGRDPRFYPRDIKQVG